MADRGALDRVSRGAEEVLRGLADALAELRTQTRSSDSTLLAGLLAALRTEIARWEALAQDDPAAARVRDLFRALLEVLDAPGRDARTSDPPSQPLRRAPRRKATR